MKLKRILIVMLISIITLIIGIIPFERRANAAKISKTLTVDRYVKSYIYDKNGKRLISYRGKKAVIPANTTLKYYGTIKYINHKPFYYLGAGGYVHANRIIQLNNKGTFTLLRNSYIYNSKGHRIRYVLNNRNVSVISLNIPINFVGTPKIKKNYRAYYFDKSGRFYYVPYKKIKNKYYYNIGNGGYIRANNVIRVNGYFAYKGSIKGKIGGLYKTVTPVDKYEKDIKNAKKYKKGQIVTFDARMLDGRGNYMYRIKGTKDEFIMSYGLLTNRMPDPRTELSVFELSSR